MSRGLVIFDCDGTLVDSETISDEVLSAALTEAGLATTQAQARARYLGLNSRSVQALVAEALGRPLPEPFWEAVREATHARLATELQPIPGAAGAVDAVIAAGWQVAVASSSGHHHLRIALTRTGLLDRFAGRVFSAADCAQGKPAPDVYLLAARTLGEDPAACIAVEDSPNGLRAAVAAGMRVFGYAGESDGAELARLGAAVFTDMSALPALIDAAALSAPVASR